MLSRFNFIYQTTTIYILRLGSFRYNKNFFKKSTIKIYQIKNKNKNKL